MAKKKKRKIDLIKNVKHKSFALEYIKNGGNGTKAYRSVYTKVTYDTASVNSYKLLRNAQISDAIQEYYDLLWEAKENEIGKTFDNLIKMANSDISDVVEYNKKDGVEIKDFDTIDTHSVQSITENISETKYGKNIIRSVKMYDKQKANSDLIKVLDMVSEKTELSGTIEVIPAQRPKDPVGKPKKVNKKPEPQQIEPEIIPEIQVAVRPEE